MNMQISNVGVSNYQDMLRLFSPEKRERINTLKSVISGETSKFSSHMSKQNGRPLLGSNPTAEEFDAWLAWGNPNHIKGLAGVGDEPFDKRIIRLPEHMEQGIKDLVRAQFARDFGGNGRPGTQNAGDELGMLQRHFFRQMDVGDRQAGAYTMTQMSARENQRIVSEVRRAVPDWRPGMTVPDYILAPILNGTSGQHHYSV